MKKLLICIAVFSFLSINVRSQSEDELGIESPRRRLQGRGYAHFVEPKYFWRGNAWKYPTYNMGRSQPSSASQTSDPPQIWCHRYQSEVRCWDWGCHWDFHYNKCRENSLMGDVNENPVTMTGSIFLRVFFSMVCACVLIRVSFTFFSASCCGGWTHVMDLNLRKYSSSDEEFNENSDDEELEKFVDDYVPGQVSVYDNQLGV